MNLGVALSALATALTCAIAVPACAAPSSTPKLQGPTFDVETLGSDTLRVELGRARDTKGSGIVAAVADRPEEILSVYERENYALLLAGFGAFIFVFRRRF